MYDKNALCWNYFKEITKSNGEKWVKCTKVTNGKECGKEYLHTGATSTLNRHLKSKHSCREIMTSSNKDKSQSISDFETLVLKLILSAAFPYHILTNKYFIEIIQKHTIFSPPTYFTIKTRENDFYEKQILEIKCIIKNIKTLAITTDGWTCKPLKKSFLALTIHFLNSYCLKACLFKQNL